MRHESLTKKTFEGVQTWLALLGILVSSIILFDHFFARPSRFGSSKDILLSILSTAVAFIVGSFSFEFSRVARKFKLSPRVFLSFSVDDKSAADDIADRLKTEGARVWMATEQVKPGDSWRKEVEKGIDAADILIVLLSGKSKGFIQFEIKTAQSKGLKIIPVLLEDVKLPSDLKGLQYVDLRSNRPQAMIDLVHAAT